MVERQTEQVQTPSFLLRPVTQLAKPTTIHYQFLPTTKPTEVTNRRATPALPIFNCDKQFFTPTFILNLDYNYYRVNRAYQGQKFEQRINESRQQISKTELVSPQPSQNFCQICRSEFENYHQHIKAKTHINFMRTSKGNKWINEIHRSMLKERRIKQKKNIGKQMFDQTVHTKKVKKKGKGKITKIMSKSDNYSRDFSDDQIRLPLTTQISFERE